MDNNNNYFSHDLNEIKKDISKANLTRLRRLVKHIILNVFSEHDLVLLLSNEETGKRVSDALTKKRRSNHKYCLVMPNGDEVFWSGSGRLPKEYGEYLGKGNTLDDLLVKKEGE